MTTEKPSFYAIIPANVRYSKDLEMGARLLYGEITALAQREGYCFATNAYFAELYDVDERTIKRWIKSLADNKFVFLETDKQGIHWQRKIWISLEIKRNFTKGQKHPHEGTKTSPVLIHTNSSSYDIDIKDSDDTSACRGMQGGGPPNPPPARAKNPQPPQPEIKSHGEFSHVKLTDQELEKLRAKFGDKLPELISDVDTKIADMGLAAFNRTYKTRSPTHYCLISRWGSRLNQRASSAGRFDKPAVDRRFRNPDGTLQNPEYSKLW